jgi:hypothetical protein
MATHYGEGASAPSLSFWSEQAESLAELRKSNRKQPEPPMSKDKLLVPAWVYPAEGGEGKIIQMELGAKPPKGFVFSPADQKPKAKAKD